MSMRSDFLSMMVVDPNEEEVRVGFEPGISPLLKRYFDELGSRCPLELREYASTSMPLEDFTTYQWTFYSASTVVDKFSQLEFYRGSHFPFAVADSCYAAISIVDGQVYTATEADRIHHEANSLADFMRACRQQMLDDQD